MLLQRYASNACAMKMLPLSRPKIAVTVSIIVLVHMPRRQGTVWAMHSQNDSGPRDGIGARLVIPGNRSAGGHRSGRRRERGGNAIRTPPWFKSRPGLRLPISLEYPGPGLDIGSDPRTLHLAVYQECNKYNGSES